MENDTPSGQSCPYDAKMRSSGSVEETVDGRGCYPRLPTFHTTPGDFRGLLHRASTANVHVPILARNVFTRSLNWGSASRSSSTLVSE